MLLTIGEVSKKLGVCITTIRRWEKLNKIKSIRTFWNHRRFLLSEINKILNKNKCYLRVSSLGQKNDLNYQTEY
jgi:excisionase family DNA binding protein